ncbi:unnamed protein product [Linum trigynum]|uniref:HTH myb-type domain-containing protein n=1 Tax=Linum trigynum TaxID=586398 RepID=A0AAV2GVL8_9ROSI
MASSSSELSLDCKPHTHHSLLLRCFSSDQIITHQPQKLEEFLTRLEEERLKIDAFKRELPLCMQLLTNAMESSRQQLQAYRGSHHQQHHQPTVALEEFIPLKNSSLPPPLESASSLEIKGCGNNTDNKANWMTTAQLWSQETTKPLPPPKDQTRETHHHHTTTTMMMGFNVSPKFGLDEAPTLALASAVGSTTEDINNDNHHDYRHEDSDKTGGNQPPDLQAVGAVDSNVNGSNGNNNNNGGSGGQNHRKARRCWSPDLHRRFVNALQMLGGSQVATPKQIRELMKVDGLTNDEVKSHLQKYRLHTRRPSPSPQAPGGPGPQLVVLGGIWVPPEYAAAAGHHFCAAPNSVPQDYYVAAGGMPIPPPPPQHHHHAAFQQHHHHQVHVYKTTSSRGHSSGPESDDRAAAGRERSESIEEDGKSESSSWKAGESGDNIAAGGGGKGLAALRENEEECDRSEITLRF